MVAEHELLANWQVLNSLWSRRRREVCAKSVLLFGQWYLGHHFKLEPSRMHTALGRRLELATQRRGIKVAVAAPRGHAKSTLVSLAYVLWSICYGHEPFIVLMSSTAGQAETLLQHVADELLTNDLLRMDFPDVCEPHGRRPRPPRWNKHEILAASGSKVLALGAGMQIRGRKHGAERPTLVILDDIETDEGVRSDDQRRKLSDWFTRAVLNAGTDRTNFVVVGTLLHDDSLLAQLVDKQRSPAWKRRVYKAVRRFATREDLWRNWEQIYRGAMSYQKQTGPKGAALYLRNNKELLLAGSHVLWPERESYPSLMLQKMVMGKYAFSSEKQNDPVDPEESLLHDTSVQYWDHRYKTLEGLRRFLGEHGRFYAGCDPSMGDPSIKGDPSALIVVARDLRDNRLYVVEADIRKRIPQELLMTIMNHCERYNFSRLYVEANGFQELYCDQIERQAKLFRLPLSVHKVKNTQNKKARIQSLQPALHNGLLQLCSTHRTLLEQLERFPRAKHDDGPDALELVVRKAFNPRDSWGWMNINI